MRNLLEFENIWDLWSDNAARTPDKEAIVHWRATDEPIRWTFKAILDTAVLFGMALRENGINKGDVCAIVIRHNPFFYPLYMGIKSIGAIPAVLAYPNPRLHPDKFRQGIMGMSQRSGLDWILSERELEPVLLPLLENSTVRGLHFPLEWDREKYTLEQAYEVTSHYRGTIAGTEPLLLQHSSGTTGLQKPVLLSHSAVIRHVQYYGESINLSENDKVASWLPLYHDMGLIAAFHTPLAFGITSIQIDPFEWVLAPVLLLDAISQEKAHLAWLPNFAYNILADKIHDDELEGLSLTSVRMLINCSEPVREESHKRFYNKFAPFGIKEQMLSACYAMAETTFAVSQTLPDTIPTSLALDKDELAKGFVIPAGEGVAARYCVSSGPVIKGCEVRIVDENRNQLPENRVGEIAISSVSMFDGYRNYPEKTAEVLQDGFYYSGDYGFVYGGEVYVIGRKKDIIIVAGKNIYPEDVENTVAKVEGVIPGRVIAFGVDDTDLGTEVVGVIAETNVTDPDERRMLKRKIMEAGLANDESINRVYLVPSRWLIKSSAGKPSRKANKERIQEANNFLVE